MTLSLIKGMDFWWSKGTVFLQFPSCFTFWYSPYKPCLAKAVGFFLIFCLEDYENFTANLNILYGKNNFSICEMFQIKTTEVFTSAIFFNYDSKKEIKSITAAFFLKYGFLQMQAHFRTLE